MSLNNNNIESSIPSQQNLKLLNQQLCTDFPETDNSSVNKPLYEALNTINSIGRLMAELEHKGSPLDTLDQLDGAVSQLEVALTTLYSDSKGPSKNLPIQRCQEIQQSVKLQMAMGKLDQLLDDSVDLNEVELRKRDEAFLSFFQHPEISSQAKYLSLARGLLKHGQVQERQFLVGTLKTFLASKQHLEQSIVPLLARIVLSDPELQGLYADFDPYQVMWLDSTDEADWSQFSPDVLAGQVLTEVTVDPKQFNEEKRTRFLDFLRTEARDRPELLRNITQSVPRLASNIDLFLALNRDLAAGSDENAPVICASFIRNRQFWEGAAKNPDTLSNIVTVLQHSPIKALNLHPRGIEAIRALVETDPQKFAGVAKWLKPSSVGGKLANFSQLSEEKKLETSQSAGEMAKLLIEILNHRDPIQDPICNRVVELITQSPENTQEELSQICSKWRISETILDRNLQNLTFLLIRCEDKEAGIQFMMRFLDKQSPLFWQSLAPLVESNPDELQEIIQQALESEPYPSWQAMINCPPEVFRVISTVNLPDKLYNFFWNIAPSLSSENQKLFPLFFKEETRELVADYLTLVPKLLQGPNSTWNAFYSGPVLEKLLPVVQSLEKMNVPGFEAQGESIKNMAQQREEAVNICEELIERVHELSKEPISGKKRQQFQSILDDGMAALQLGKREVIALLSQTAVSMDRTPLLFTLWGLDLPRARQIGESATADTARRVFAQVVLDKDPKGLSISSSLQTHSALHFFEAITQLLNTGKLQEAFGEDSPIFQVVKDKILPLIEDSLPRAYVLRTHGIAFDSQAFQEKIQQLPVGESLYFPLALACRNSPEHHAIGWRIQRSSASKVSFFIYNTGWGIKAYHHRSKEKPKYYQTWLEISDVPFEYAGDAMWEQLNPLLSDNNTTIEDFYEFLMNQGTPSGPSPEINRDYQRPQESGTCATLCNLAMIRHMLTSLPESDEWYPEDFKNAWHFIKQGIKIELWNSFRPNIPNDVSLAALPHLHKAQAFTSEALVQALISEQAFNETAAALIALSTHFPEIDSGVFKFLKAQMDPEARPMHCMERYRSIKEASKLLANAYLAKTELPNTLVDDMQTIIDTPFEELPENLQNLAPAVKLVLPYIELYETNLHYQYQLLKILLTSENPHSADMLRHASTLIHMKGGDQLLIKLMAKWVNSKHSDIIERLAEELEWGLPEDEMAHLLQTADSVLEPDLAQAVKKVLTQPSVNVLPPPLPPRGNMPPPLPPRD